MSSKSKKNFALADGATPMNQIVKAIYEIANPEEAEVAAQALSFHPEVFLLFAMGLLPREIVAFIGSYELYSFLGYVYKVKDGNCYEDEIVQRIRLDPTVYHPGDPRKIFSGPTPEIGFRRSAMYDVGFTYIANCGVNWSEAVISIRNLASTMKSKGFPSFVSHFIGNPGFLGSP